MFSNFFRNILFKVTVNASSSIIHYRSKSDFKVTVMGASGGIGLPLCLQLKQCPLIEELSICDILNAHAVGDDIAFMDTKSKVTSYSYPGEANKAFTNARVVVMVAGVPRKPPMSREDLFKINAPIVMGVAENCVKYCPEAALIVVTNPVNSMVPIASEVFFKANKNNDNKIFGFTTLDLVRASTFVAAEADLESEEVSVPVIGGHSETTIVPVFSQTYPHAELSQECSFFSTPVELGAVGIKKNLGLPLLNEYENCLLSTAIPTIQKDIEKGIKFVYDTYLVREQEERVKLLCKHKLKCTECI